MSRSKLKAAVGVRRKAKGKAARRHHDKLMVEVAEDGALVYRPRGRNWQQVEE